MNHKNTSREYAFLMVEYKMPKFIKDIQDKIKKEELYTEEDNDDFGLEKHAHVTLVPCLNNDVNLDELRKYLKPIKDYKIILTNISKFECEKYDVLKCDVQSDVFKETNKTITNKFDTHTEYKNYQPHLTIAYMKHGMADKYCKEILSKLEYLTPTNFYFSYVDNEGNQKDEKFDFIRQ